MSALLDSLCGAERLAEIAANEAAMHIVSHEEPGLEVVEVWSDFAPLLPMEPEGE